jgi:sialate O-acetylesterase
MFPLLIKQWRKDWNQPELPFYWVQLPNHGERAKEPVDGYWPALRDAQTKAMKLPHTGQAVTIDIGDGNSLHPKNKLDVAARLARWALAKDYGMDMPCRSPLPIEVTLKDSGKIALRFESVGRGLVTRQSDAVTGFALCGADKQWHWAHGDIVDYNMVEVWSETVPKPVAIRYCWTDNPECNLFTREGLPATPFRTDDYELVLPEKPAPASAPANGTLPQK